MRESRVWPSILPVWLWAESAACLYQRVKNTSMQERSCPSGRPKEILSPHLIARKKNSNKKKKSLKQAGSHLSTATHWCSGEQLYLHKASLFAECRWSLRDGNVSPSQGTRCSSLPQVWVMVGTTAQVPASPFAPVSPPASSKSEGG